MSTEVQIRAYALLAFAVFAFGLPACRSGSAPISRQPEAPDVAALRAEAGAPAPAPPRRVVLKTIPVPGDPRRQFELGIEPCRAERCPVVVTLVEAGRTLGVAELTWAAISQDASEQPVERGWGGTDPVDFESGAELKAWTTGEEATFVATMVEPLAFGEAVGALLVNQVAGFEHLKRSHAVFVAAGPELVRAWSATEGDGPTFSAATVIPGAPGRKRVAYFEQSDFTTDSDTQPDALKGEVLGWDGHARKLAPVEGEGHTEASIQAIVLGPFKTVRDAKRAREADPACLGGFAIVPGGRFRGIAGQAIVLARLTASWAAKASSIVGCVSGKKARVTSIVSSRVSVRNLVRGMYGP